MGLQRAHGAARCDLLPQVLDEAVDADDFGGGQQQSDQQGPLLRPPEVDDPRAVDGLQGAKDPEVDHAAAEATRPVSSGRPIPGKRSGGW